MDLKKAQQRYEVKKKIASVLQTLDMEDRIVVLSDLLAEADDAPPPIHRYPEQTVHRRVILNGVDLAKRGEDGDHLWERIVAWCEALPRPTDIYTSMEVADALKIAG